jgi:uncharacterized membrane protein (DUF2068 family)
MDAPPTTAALPQDRPGTDPAGPRRGLTRRETRWVLRRCAKRGHVLAHLDDEPLSRTFSATAEVGPLLRCLRCGDFVPAAPIETTPSPSSQTTVIGTPEAPAALAEVPLAVRGGHGRKLALLRVLAVERGGRGLVLLLAAAGIARLATSHVAVAEWLGHIVKAAQPLGDALGLDLEKSATVTKALDLLGHSDSTFSTLAWLLGGYGALQIVEGVGLWGGWLWAEYLAAIATSAFIPLEVYELFEKVSVFKAGALLINVAAVVYLVYKGRLFAVRGGHPAYLAEVRDSTLLAEELHAAGRPSDVLTSHELV